MPKAVVTVEREVAAPAEKVWAMVSDLTRMGEWSPENTGSKWLKGATGPAVGVRFKGKNQQGWRRWSTAGKVIECEPGRKFAFDVFAAGFNVARWTYRIEPTEGGCKVEETWEDKRSMGVMNVIGHLASGVGDRESYNRQGMEETLANLAKAAEAPA
jgi:uncharacterized protein YndB with AHSA1/START domain